MCTVTWAHQDGGYQLLCNRDEKLTRSASSGPVVANRGGVRFVAPLDGDRGGSWICANEFGLSLCLLNGANLTGADRLPRKPAVDWRSRGLLMLDWAPSESIAEVCDCFARADLEPYDAFTLVAMEPGAPAAVLEWTRDEKVVLLSADAVMPLVSSSFDPRAARERRTHLFQRKFPNGAIPAPAQLHSFHESHERGPSAFSPCMHRRDAGTVSFSWINVTPHEAAFFYSPGAPCEWRDGQLQRLARR